MVLVLSMNACATAGQEPTQRRLDFELEQVYGVESSPREAMLGLVRGVTVDDRGNLYVTDSGFKRVASFSESGALRWVAGGEGQGPGEFTNLGGIAWSEEDVLYVANNRGAEIQRWSTTGEYIDVLPVDDVWNGSRQLVGILPDGLLVLSTAIRGAVGVRISILAQKDGSFVTEREVEDRSDETLPPALAAGPGARVSGGTVTVGSVGRYHVKRLGQGDRLETVVSQEADYLVPPVVLEADGRASIMLLGGMQAPFILPTGQVLIYGSWRVTDDPERALIQAQEEARSGKFGPPATFEKRLDLFSLDGRLLDTLSGEDLRLESLGVPLTIDHRGRLYTYVEEPFPQIRRYHVQLPSE